MKYIIMAMAIASTLAFTACGSSESNRGGVVATVPAAVPAAVVPGSVPTSCQVGQVNTTQYGCLNRQSCQEGYGWYPASSLCVAGTVVTNNMIYGGPAIMNYEGTMSITNRDQYSLMLRASGQCGPYAINFGSLNCDNYLSQPYIRISSYSGLNSTVSVQLITRGDWTSNYSYMTVSFMGTVQAYNGNAGFVIRGTYGNGVDSGIRIVAENGNMGTGYPVPVSILWQSGQIGAATLQRY